MEPKIFLQGISEPSLQQFAGIPARPPSDYLSDEFGVGTPILSAGSCVRSKVGAICRNLGIPLKAVKLRHVLRTPSLKILTPLPTSSPRL
jgi:hypothetical protein